MAPATRASPGTAPPMPPTMEAPPSFFQAHVLPQALGAAFFIALFACTSPPAEALWVAACERFGATNVGMAVTSTIPTATYWTACAVVHCFVTSPHAAAAAAATTTSGATPWVPPMGIKKLQGNAHTTPADAMAVVPLVLRNQGMVLFPYLFYAFVAMPWRCGGGINGAGIDTCSFSAPFPTPRVFLAQLACWMLVVEVFFYHNHRLMHTVPWLYKRFHKQHHAIHVPFASGTIACSAVEHLVVNTFPIFAGGFVCGMHMYAFMLLSVVANLNAINAHCGFIVPGLPSPLAHDVHHQRPNKNFGTLGLFDWLYGTASSCYTIAEENKAKMK